MAIKKYEGVNGAMEAMQRRMDSPAGRMGKLVAAVMTGNPSLAAGSIGDPNSGGNQLLSLTGKMGGGSDKSAVTGQRDEFGAANLGVDNSLGAIDPELNNAYLNTSTPKFNYSADTMGRRQSRIGGFGLMGGK